MTIDSGRTQRNRYRRLMAVATVLSISALVVTPAPVCNMAAIRLTVRPSRRTLVLGKAMIGLPPLLRDAP